MKNIITAKNHITYLILLSLLILPALGYAVPQKINFQGYITDSDSNPLDGIATMLLSIYDVDTGGTALWTETQNVSVNGGIYNVNLGEVNPINLPFDKQYYLGVKVGTDPEMTRQELTSVPYAMSAESATVAHKISCNKYEFVGFSTGTSNVTGGVLKFNQMCQADYPNSRMCTSEEILNTVNVPSAVGQGWVRLSIVGYGQYQGSDLLDMSGLEFLGGYGNCRGWNSSTSGDQGFVVATDGKFNKVSCGSVQSIACCAPSP